MRDAKQAELTGRAGEHAVAVQLLLRGLVPFWPDVDRGCDVATEAGCRLQIKCAHLLQHPYGPRYHFPLPKTRGKPFSAICDFVVLWGIEQNRFWIVSASIVDQITGVDLGFDSKLPRFVGNVSDMREMLKLGYTRYQVAKHYGIQRTSLQQFLDSGKDTIDETVVSQIRACEGRWEQILDFVNPAFARSVEEQPPIRSDDKE